MKIDTAKLPKAALIDTGVVLRFLGNKADAESEVCRLFGEAMVRAGRMLWIAAPTIAEVARYAGEAPPKVVGVSTIAFSAEIARTLGKKLPNAKIHETAVATGISKTYLKYDSMIAATALHHGLTLVALDSDHAVLLKATGATVQHPRDFLAAPELFDLIAT